jgi:hypothetical protein
VASRAPNTTALAPTLMLFLSDGAIAVTARSWKEGRTQDAGRA